MNKPAFSFFTHGEIKPEGWLKKQLRIQADGLSGNLDKVWPDIRDSRWIGGNRDGWERVPYWLDGFVPLAYLLNDKELIQRAQKYINCIIDQQAEDGWLCPCTIDERHNYDVWPGFLIAKVLTLYADLSGDTRIDHVVYRYFQNLYEFTHISTIHNWASLRWFEALIPLYWLYERHPEEWILRLADCLEQQGFDYEKLFNPYKDQIPQRVWTYSTHVVNLGMAIKQGALVSLRKGGDPERFAKKMLKNLFKYHGMAVGHFTGDECVMGNSPVQGTELCSIVEAMYSYENLISISGNPIWGDYLERLAFNALPATISADMWTHQYDQLTNQVRCTRLPEDHIIFGTNSSESHLFGLEPNFGCCTANFNQGWPKFALSTFMKSDNGIVSAALAPSSLSTEINKTKIKITLSTDYPFRDKLRYAISVDQPVHFELKIRIPSWAKKAVVDGQKATSGDFYCIDREWKGETVINVKFDFECTLADRPRKMKCLWRGPLLYSVAIKERWEMLEYTRTDVERKFPYCDYEIFPESPWNYGFTENHQFKVTEQSVGTYPFSGETPPVEIEAMLAPLDWPVEYGVVTIEPRSRTPIGKPVAVRMIPYGCARLRMTEMPEIE